MSSTIAPNGPAVTDHFNASFWLGDLTQSRVPRSRRLFAEEVMPAFR